MTPPRTLATTPSAYIPAIDGLRALAVLAVMLFHLHPAALPGGFTGVDVFFVISGYVVSRSLARDAGYPLLGLCLRFYARRIRRIFPALVVCLLVTSLVNTLFVPKAWLSDSVEKTALHAFAGLGNIALLRFNDGYFSPRVEFNAFAHTWSLGVEEQFYLIFPLLLFFWLRHHARPGIRGHAARCLLPLLLCLSLVLAWKTTAQAPFEAFYLLPARFWELGSGALLFQMQARGFCLPRRPGTRNITLLVGCIAVAAGFALAEKQSFPFPWALLPVCGSLLLIAACQHSPAPPAQRLLEHRTMAHLGRISYSLYLWHWPVFVLARWSVGLETVPVAVTALALTFALAHASYFFVEQPMRSHPFLLRQPPGITVAVGVTVIALAMLTSQAMFAAQERISLSVTRDRKIWYPNRWKTRQPGKKLFAGKKIFCFGDSHAGAYATMLQRLADEYGAEFELTVITRGCGPANLIYPVLYRRRCRMQIDGVLRRITATARRGDIVFIASLRMQRFTDQWAVQRTRAIRHESDLARRGREQALNEARYILKILAPLGVRVIIDAPKPVFMAPPFRCSDWFNRNNPVCAHGFEVPRGELEAHRQFTMQSLQVLQQEFPGLIVWDPLPVLCPGEVCSAFDARGLPLFFDGDHLSGHGNQVLYPSFSALVRTIWSTEEQPEGRLDPPVPLSPATGLLLRRHGRP